MRWNGCLGELGEALEGDAKVGAALGGDHRVDLVDDDALQGAGGFARLAGEHEVERFRRGDEDVGRIAVEGGAVLAGVSPVRMETSGRGRRRPSARPARIAREGFAEVALDVDGEGFERGDVEDAAAVRLWRDRART